MANKNPTRLGDLLSLARDLKGWTLRKLEAESGISNALLSQIETGHVKDPGFSTVVKIADALNLPIERLAKAVRPTSQRTAEEKI